MNARQKAKKYKKIAERYKDKAEAYNRIMRSEAFNKEVHKRCYGTIETVKILKYWDDRVPDIFVRREIANELGKYCLENDLICFEVNDNYDEYNGKRRVVGILKIAKQWGESEE